MQNSMEQLQSREHYGHSLSGVRALGSLAVEFSAPELLGIQDGRVNRSWNDLYTKVEEHIATDPEHGEALFFDTSRTFEIRDGHAVTEHGERIVEMVVSGHKSALEAAKTESRMSLQAERDGYDVELAEAVDTLEVGEMIGALSFDPKQAIKQDKEFWEEKMNYREGMAIWQWYYRVSETELRTGVVSIKQSDEKAMRNAFARLGHKIPEQISDAEWIRHHVRNFVTIDEAKDYGRRLKTNHRAELADSSPDHSVTEFLQTQMPTMQRYFETYMPSLAVAAYNGKPDNALRELASALSRVETVAWAKRVQLLQIHKKELLDDDDVRLLDTMVTYALVEELRKELPSYMRKDVKPEQPTVISMQFDQVPLFVYGTVLQQQNDLIRQMVQNVRAGTEAGRSYGGCSGSSVHQKSGNNAEDNVLPDFQDVFGGKLHESSQDKVIDEDQFGALDFECTKGHKNRRPRGKLIPHCKTCGENVSCAPDEKPSAPKPTEVKANVISLLKIGVENERAKAA